MRHRWLLIPLLLAWTVFVPAAELTVLAVSDVHGQWQDGENGAGWPRLATLLNRERERAGMENTLLIDCGDELSGSMQLALSGGVLGVEVLNFLEFDVWVPGNHDFEWGVARLRELMAQFHGRVIAANWEGEPAVARFERAGLRIAVIGLTSGVLDWYLRLPDGMPKLITEQKALKLAMAEVTRQPCDVIILAVHRGIYASQAQHLAELIADYPEIDLVLGGHTHVISAGEAVKGIHFTAPGGHGAGVSRIVLDIPEAGKRGARKIASEFIPVTPKVPPSRELVRSMSRKFRLDANSAVLGRTTPAPSRSSKRRYASSFGTLALSGLTAGLPAGTVGLYGNSTSPKAWPEQITERELFAMFPYHDRVAGFRVSRQELTEIIEEQLRMAEKHPYQPVMTGIRVTADTANRVTAFDPELAEYELVTSDFIAAGGGGRYEALHRIGARKQWRFFGILRERVAALLLNTPFPVAIAPEEWLTRLPPSRQLR